MINGANNYDKRMHNVTIEEHWTDRNKCRAWFRGWEVGPDQ